jgi:hypothetical protein
MNRRNFFSLLAAGVAGIALEQAIPFGRVWSFPKKIVLPRFVGMDLAAGDIFTIRQIWRRPHPTAFVVTRCEIAAGWNLAQINAACHPSAGIHGQNQDS